MSLFVVHEHHARALHFDFRLEIEGVLKSWAIPKGPSMNPADKRLAVLVDDHPLSYATYEGIIPAGQYGAGPVIIWDHGTFAIKKGSFNEHSLVLTLAGKQLKGDFSLFQFKDQPKNWLLVKKADAAAIPGFKLKTLIETKKLSEQDPGCTIS